ncbi:bromodomain-containing protein DDB_G0280777 [Camponotus floridanus]|uniref:bromodomain-containing protein DDB_G0280777 n=1 Tax=Camponotus floridanus TaxID=104421 RepID=UPI000DC67A03|nr:bromodomain-containing protein DDB_G0280777 [Camponotus floridanus]
MLLQRLRWLLPALIVSLMNPQLSAPLPAHNERPHIPVNTFDPSVATSTMIRQDYNKRVHPPNGKNDTQSSHKLVASPAGLLRPDKFQFYTYNDNGDMITRQMTAQEIQGLIAAGGADHVPMDRQEPQKADDVLTGGKKVMDVVQKVQNVLKSALDKPPILTGSIPKIPEHANVEWSNILPSILSGEADAISPNSESNQLLHKLTTEKIQISSTESANVGISLKNPTTKKPAVSDVQTNAYAGFTNNKHHNEKLQLSHYSQQTSADIITEKPMIPVPVITLTEQKLSTLHSAITESPIFQMLSVIPVESTHKTTSQTNLYAADIDAASFAQPSTQIEGFNQTEQFVEITLSEVPEATTFSQPTSLDTHPVNITKSTTTNPDNQASQEIKVPVIYSTTIPNISTDAPTVTKQAVTYESIEVKNADKVSSSSNASYVLIQDKNNTKQSEDFSFIPEITKESQTNVTYNDDKIFSQANTVTSEPLSHASVPVREETASNKITHSPSTFATASTIEVSTVPTLLHTDYHRDEGSSIVTKESSSSITSTYTENYLNSQSPAEIQSLELMEPLPTQLIDSFSNVMNQVSEVRPTVLSLSDEAPPEISIININYNQRRNVSDSDKPASANVNTFMSHDTNEMNVEHVSSQTYIVTTEIPSQDVTTKLIDHSIAQQPVNTMNRESITDASANSRITMTTSTASIKTETTNNEITANNILVTTPAGPNVELISTKMESTASSSPVQIQLEKIHDASSLGNQTKTLATLETTTAINVLTLQKQAIDQTTELPEEILPVTSTLDVVTKTQSTTASSESLNKMTSEYFDNVFANLNLSNPVSAIDQVLNIVPQSFSTPEIEPIGLPSDTTNFVASDLASSLIAGFATSTSERSSLEEISENETVQNASNNATKFAESTESITKIYEETVRFNVSEYQEDKNILQTSTQKTLTEPARNSTKESNDTLKPIKLSNSNESNIDDPTKVSLATSLNKFANVSDESKDSVGQSTITEEVVAVNPEQSLNINTTNNQKKTENKEKVKTTEAPIIKIDETPELPGKIELIDSANANNTRNSVNASVHAENSSKIETLSEKNESFVNASSTTKEAVQSANNSNFEFYSSHKYINNVTDINVSNVTSNTPIISNENPVNLTLLQNRVNNTTDYKNKNKNNINNNNNNNNSLSSLSIQEHVKTDRPIIEIVKKPTNASDIKEELSQPSPINSTNNLNSTNNASNQNNKDVTQIIPVVNSFSSIKNASISQTNSNNDSKPASLKHSENFSKPEVTPPSIRQTSKPTVGPKLSEKSNASKTEMDGEHKWTLISQQTSPVMSKPPKPLRKPVNPVQTQSSDSVNESVEIRPPGNETEAVHQFDQQDQHTSTQSVLPLWDASQSASGLDVTTKHTSADIINFARLCNELAFNFWVATNKGLSTARSLALSPFGMTSLLAMIFLGARGPTSDQMNEVLGLDDVATFNPHLVFQNITDTVSLARSQGIANAAFVRELFADKMKVRKLMPFYKEQAQQFYEGLVAEVNFATISDLVRRRTNLLVRKQTGGRIKDFVKTNTVPLRSPLAALSANVFQTDCNSTLTSSIGRDGELYFAVSPAVRQRKLVPVPATTWRSGVLAGYEPSIDATAVALGGSDKLVSTIFVLPGQQGHTAPGDTLDRLEQRLVRSAFRDGAWNKLLKTLIPRNGLELQVPKFSHRSVVNATAALKRMGLDELFSGNADFKGINGVGHRLYLADVLQMNLFSTCGDENILNGRHHVETYPASPLRSIRRQMENIDNFANISEEDASRYGGITSSQENHMDSFYMDQSHMDRFYREKRQPSGLSERPRLKLDRPFLYFVRHNPSGLILHMGRFNPRLLP